MKNVKIIVFLVLSVGSGYGMQNHETSTATPVVDARDACSGERGQAVTPETGHAIATAVANELERRVREKAAADHGDDPVELVRKGALVGSLVTLALAPIDFFLIMQDRTDLFSVHFHRNVVLGAAAGFGVWMVRNPAAARDLMQQVANDVASGACESYQVMAACARAQRDKPRDWAMLDELLAANNTF